MEGKIAEQERGADRARREEQGKARQRKPDGSGETRQEDGLGDNEGKRTGLGKASPSENLCLPTPVCVSKLQCLSCSLNALVLPAPPTPGFCPQVPATGKAATW